jgi:hypothetical protein
MMKRNTVFSVCVVLLVTCMVNVRAEASTVANRSFKQIVTGSELIFEGRVLSKEVRPSSISGMPFTYFTFQILAVIKGVHPYQTIEIGYMGGPSGELTLEVSDMRMPEVDERGIYFVESPGNQQIHPLAGWQQGHYLIYPNAKTGRDIVVPAQYETAKVRGRALMTTHGTPLDDFKQNIQDIMGGIR